MRESTRVCKYGACDFLLRKNGCSSSLGLLQFFRGPNEYCFIDGVR